MEDFAPTLFTKVVLYKVVDVKSVMNSFVALEVDASYSIGKSVAVLHEGNIIGHVDRRATPVVWRFLRSDCHLTAEIYGGVGNWKNERWFSVMTHSFEVGVRISFAIHSRDDAKLLLMHICRRKLNSFPGVEVDNCPAELVSQLQPVKDKNGITSLQFPPMTS